MNEWIGPAIVAAVISAIVTAFGWYASHESSRRLEASRRQERIVDFQTALRAEIRSHREQLRLFAVPGTLDEVVGKILDDSSPGYTPFVPSDAGSIIFEAVVRDIHILPTSVLDPVVYYYRQIAALRLFAEDLRGSRYARLEPARKVTMYRDYVALGTHALKLADEAIHAIEGV